MAFKIPAHLPRGGIPQDRPTELLSRLSQTSNKSLKAQLVASWLEELDFSIQDIKDRISRRINEDLPDFERQYDSSFSIQRRLLELSGATNDLTDVLNNPQNGIVPTLLHSLSTHNILAIQTMDSSAILLALEHLSQLRDDLHQLTEEVSLGMLAKASRTCSHVHQRIRAAPSPLQRADIMLAIQKRFRIMNDTVQEQLHNAYAQCVTFTQGSNGLSLRISTLTTAGSVPMSISLSEVLASLSSEFLIDRLAALRRDLLSKFIEPIVKSSQSLETSLDLSPNVTLSNSAMSSDPLKSLRILHAFLDTYFFPQLPLSQRMFHATLHIPISMAILTHFLKPSLPSSLQDLPSYLDTLTNAIQFEEEFLSTYTQPRPINDWAVDVANHYEKKRREYFWQQTRTIAMKPDDGLTFEVQMTSKLSTSTRGEICSAQKPDISDSEDFSSWDDEEAAGWGFNEAVSDEENELASFDTSSQKPTPYVSENVGEISDSLHENNMDDEADGWGWDEEADPAVTSEILGQARKTADGFSQEKAEEDSPWESDNWSIDPGPSLQPGSGLQVKPSVAAPAPKLAKRLEKFSAKTKGSNTRSVSNNEQTSPQFTQPTSPPKLLAPAVVAQRRPLNIERIRQKEGKTKDNQETYLVSMSARTVLDLVGHILQECEELSGSSVFTVHGNTAALVPGQLLLVAAPSILDLYRAMFPISHDSLLQHNSSSVMQWSNDCNYLAKEARTLGKDDTSKDRWAETVERLQILGDLNFENAIAKEQEAVQKTLRQAGGFVHASNTSRYSECRDSIQGTLQELEGIAARWKTMLTRDNYLRAIGRVIDEALFYILDNILLLDDIPEADSERLSELCEMFNILENLFVYTPGDESVIGSYVPLWFKFSYLSWLIKGSIADISYLFDEGMLVDYDIEELVRLVRALFAETPLRENTIAKFMRGHPNVSPTEKQP